MAKKKAQVEPAPKTDQKLPPPAKGKKSMPKPPEKAHEAWAKKIKKGT